MVEIRIARVTMFMMVIIIVMMMAMLMAMLMAMTTMMMNLATINLSKIVWERKGGERCRRQELCLSCLSRQRQ